jgi:hypothetical protein
MKKYFIGGSLIFAVLAIALAVSAQSEKVFFKLSDNDTIYRAYQTAAEFFSDGGAQDFSNVQVVEPNIGAVTQGNDYYGTTTLVSNLAGQKLLKGGYGALGSITVTKAGAAGSWMSFYDATTSAATARVNTATTTLATIPTDLAAGTYIFDVNFNYGLLVDFSTAQGTTTITWR